MRHTQQTSANRRIAFFAIILAVIIAVAVAVADQASFDVAYPATVGGSTLSIHTTMDDDWFDAPSSGYSHSLAKLSISMTVAAFRDNKVDASERDHYARSFMETTGFTGYASYGYDQDTGDNTVSNVIAMRRLTDDQGEYILLAVPICGQGYGNEWLGNFNVGEGTEHQGFANAADQVYARVLAYVDANCSGERVKVWVSGFSRSAAVSNLVGDRLLRDDRFAQDDIFVYTFGTPATTQEPTAWPQIFNICRTFDPVPKLPLVDWGYQRNGTTYYLPSMETDPDYDESDARVFYEQMVGKTDFGEEPALNFLLTTVLNLLYQNMPAASDYVGAYQEAVIAAWDCKDGMIEKLNVFLDVLQKNNVDTTHLEEVKHQFFELASIGLNDTMDLVQGQGGDEKWVELFSSGMAIAREHFPEGYIAWIYSTDDPDELYSQGEFYRTVAWSGKMDAVITVTDPETSEPVTVYDTKQGIKQITVISLQGRTCVMLPAVRTYQITLTAQRETQTQIGYSLNSAASVDVRLSSTNTLTLYRNEQIVIRLPEMVDHAAVPVVSLNGESELPLTEGGSAGSTALTLRGASSSVQRLLQMTSGVIIMVPWLLAAVLVLIFALFVGVKRLIRHRLVDDIPCRKPGRVVLLLAALAALTFSAFNLVQLITRVSSIHGININNRTMQRVSEYLGWGTGAYHASAMVVYLMLAVFSYRSIHHRLSRKRTLRHAALIMILNCLSVFMSVSMNLFSVTDVLVMLVPISAIAGVVLAHAPEPEDLARSKRILPVIRVALITILLFLIRQVIYALAGPTNQAAVLMKTLTGLPLAAMAIDLNNKMPSFRRRYTMIAIVCYLAANAVINLSPMIGTLIFMLGHCMLIYSNVKKCPPKTWQYVMWILMSIPFLYEAHTARNIMPGFMIYVAGPYVMIVVALAISALRLSRRIRFGCLMMIIANQLLVFTWLAPGMFVLDSTELFVYYISIIALASDIEVSESTARKNDAALAEKEEAAPTKRDDRN